MTAMLSNGTLTCVWGRPARYDASPTTYCPAVGGFSSWFVPLLWYSIFLLTMALCIWRGRRLKRDARGELNHLSAVVSYLDCESAHYSDEHLWVWFAVVTLSCIFSLLARVAAQPPGRGLWEACVRDGDWDGHWGECAPGGLVELSSHILMIMVLLTFLAGLIDQGSLPRTRAPEKNIERGGAEMPDQRHHHTRFRYQTAVSKKILAWTHSKTGEMSAGRSGVAHHTHFTDPLTAVAMKMKALIRRQAHYILTGRAEKDSPLAHALKLPFLFLSWAAAVGLEGDSEPFGDEQALMPDFQPRLAGIMAELEHGPTHILRETEQLRQSMLGNPSEQEQIRSRERFARAVGETKKWNESLVAVEISSEYDFDKLVRELQDAPDSLITMLKDRKIYLFFKGHTVLGALVGLVGFGMISLAAPLGDAYYSVGYLISQETQMTWIEDYCDHRKVGESPWFGVSAQGDLMFSRKFWPGSFLGVRLWVT
ncbi:unnamed protein product [Polarella glacialis]|uniref:Uncharacterized protein n=1 Tax=Polarella glacialis TaxID=89957 RepID=A0A813DRC0_POLGL|nr:unnamed protein product [Polarella glacialis]